MSNATIQESMTSAQSYLLAADAFYCEIDEGAMFLKLSTLKYYGVESRHVAAMRRTVSGWPQADVDDCATHQDHAAALAELLDSGFLTTQTGTGKQASPPIARAQESFTLSRRSQSRAAAIRDVLRFVDAYWRTRRALSNGRFKEIVTRLERRKKWQTASDTSALPASVQQLIATFRRLRPWLYSSRNACLLDSIALVEFLSYHGVIAALVIGVNTKPFGAHAWVQLGPVVINDTAEHVNEYTPILMAPS